MAAGLGFKTFNTGDVLTAADTNGYLMQGVLVFASAAARDAAITSPQEGQFAYLKDTNVTTYYTGSAWTNLDTTGMVNPMTTTGDTIYSSSGSTPARLGIGSTGDILTVAGGVPTWAAPAGGGGMTSIASGSLSGTSVTISSISGSYKNLVLVVRDIRFNIGGDTVRIRFNGNTSSVYGSVPFNGTSAAVSSTSGSFNSGTFADYADSLMYLSILDYANTTTFKMQQSFFFSQDPGASQYNLANTWGFMGSTNAVTSITLLGDNGGTFNAGTYILYGVS